MARAHYFAGVDLLQDYPEQQSYMEQTYGNDFEQPSTFQPKEQYKPTNLGIDLFTTLQNEYNFRRKVKTYSADALYDLWKVTNKRKIKPQVSTKEPDNELEKRQKQHRDNLQFYSQADQRDVLYTLRYYAKEEEQDANISKFLEERKSQIRQQDKEKQKPKKMSKEVLSRLYPNKTQQFEDPKQIESNQRNQFVENVIKSYKQENPEAKNYKYPDLLIEYWKQMNNRPEGQEQQFKEYFDESMEIVKEYFYKFKGFHTDKAMEIVKVWRQMPDKQQIVQYESEDNLKALLNAYIQDQKQNENITAGLRKMQLERMKQQPKKDVNFQKLDTLAKPKDRLKVGKTLLELKKMYPNDKILRRMLLEEFQDTKVAKHPLEYDVVDSDEDNKIKVRHTSQKGGAVMNLEELEVPANMKADEIAELFDRQLQEYYSQKQIQLRQEKQKEQKIKQEDNKLKAAIEQLAKRFLEMRKRRLEEKVPTVNKFLSTTYKQLLVSHSEAMKRNFPHSTKGESKKLRKKSFPGSFKRYFFSMMRTYVRRRYDYLKDKSGRLGFWVPTNGKSMCVLHKDSLCPPGCNKQTLNQRVYNQSRLVKEQKVAAQKVQTTVWENEHYIQEKKNIMMTFSDAKECTFQPAVCYKMPIKYKKLVFESLPQAQALVGRQGDMKHFLEQFGDNFKRVPTIYRYGQFKRAQVVYRKGDYRKSYQLLAQAFNIKDLKIIFNDKDLKKQKEHPIFNYENLGLDEEDLKKIPHENMQLVDQEQQNNPDFLFLFDVYSFIKQLEKYEEELVNAQKHTQKLLQADRSRFSKPSAQSTRQTQSMYDLRKQMVKAEMCPMGQNCPSLQTRWPNSNVTGVNPIGAECLFAHHPYELKFQQELRAKKKALKATLTAINSQLSGNIMKKAWNPGGNTLSKCIGCPENALCSDCQLKKVKLKKLAYLRKMAKASYLNICKKGSFKEKRKVMKEEESHYQEKVRILSRATALCNKERYSEAFEVIVKAVEIIKQEIELKEQQFQQTQQQLKQQLKLDPDLDVSLKQVYESTLEQNPDDKYEAQKLHMYAKKTGIDRDPEPDTNRFINTQIELLYRRIEKALEGTVQDIELMKKRINKLEDQEDIKQKNKKQDHNKQKMCPDFINEGQCKVGKEHCPYIHNYLELDLEPVESKLKNLQESIKVKSQNLRDSKPPLPWVSCSVKDAEKFNDTKAYDKELEKKKLIKSKSRQSSSSARDKSKRKNLYEEDIDDIKTPVYERKKKSNY